MFVPTTEIWQPNQIYRTLNFNILTSSKNCKLLYLAKFVTGLYWLEGHEGWIKLCRHYVIILHIIFCHTCTDWMYYRLATRPSHFVLRSGFMRLPEWQHQPRMYILLFSYSTAIIVILRSYSLSWVWLHETTWVTAPATNVYSIVLILHSYYCSIYYLEATHTASDSSRGGEGTTTSFHWTIIIIDAHENNNNPCYIELWKL